MLKQKYKLLMEDYILDKHFKNEKMTVHDEQASWMAVEAYNSISKGIVKDRVECLCQPMTLIGFRLNVVAPVF